MEIEEKINKVRWCATSNGSQFILSTNDKTIKLWKVCNFLNKSILLQKVDPMTDGSVGVGVEVVGTANQWDSYD